MKKKIITKIFCLSFLLFCSSQNLTFAEMQVESLSIGYGEATQDNVSQTFKHEEFKTSATTDETSQNIQSAPIIYNNNYYYNPYYYPNSNVYTRRIGPYGVYSNFGVGSFDYKGHSFSYNTGFNRPIYVGPPVPPPPPPKPPHHHDGPPHNIRPDGPKPNHQRPY